MTTGGGKIAELGSSICSGGRLAAARGVEIEERTVVIFVNERNPVLDECAQDTDHWSLCGALSESVQLRTIGTKSEGNVSET